MDRLVVEATSLLGPDGDGDFNVSVDLTDEVGVAEFSGALASFQAGVDVVDDVKEFAEAIDDIVSPCFAK